MKSISSEVEHLYLENSRNGGFSALLTCCLLPCCAHLCSDNIVVLVIYLSWTVGLHIANRYNEHLSIRNHQNCVKRP